MNKNNDHKRNDHKHNELCHNCGSTGHLYIDCKLAIISIGIILYRKNKQTNEFEFLMIRRNESFGFSDFFYSKNINYNLSIIENVINEMTIIEKKNILSYLKNNDCSYFTEQQKKKITTISNLCDSSKLLNLSNIIEDSTTIWTEPEWGFPKGRRNNSERELDCALREFEEETGINKYNIKLIENIIPYEEIFIASNYKTYKHKYFIAEVDDDVDYNLDNYQKAEVSKIKWLNLEDAIESIRPYNSEKKTMLMNISKLLKYNTIL
jgi:8-oxo-dGTP pyrophosphatase MutT (NUDIX family)